MANKVTLGTVDLSTLLLPVTGELLIVPSVVVEEIIKRRELVVPPQHPSWLLGFLKWHEQLVPVLSFEDLNGSRSPDSGNRSRIVIFNVLTEGSVWKYYALITQGVPHLMLLTRDNFQQLDNVVLGAAERMKFRLHGQLAAIPDLDYIERLLGGRDVTRLLDMSS